MKRRPRNPLHYYLRKVPKPDKESGFSSVEEAIESYKAWKQAISEFYLPNEEVKQNAPAVYACLIKTELTDYEIKTITAEYYEEAVIHYSDSLSGADYELE
jgi:hypothetical protein